MAMTRLLPMVPVTEPKLAPLFGHPPVTVAEEHDCTSVAEWSE
jgi:hypothetical protein